MLDVLEPETPLGLEPAMDAKTIGERIRVLRLARKLSQVRLAEVLGTSQQNVARWEGGTEIPASRLPDIAAALGVPVGKLFPSQQPKPRRRN